MTRKDDFRQVISEWLLQELPKISDRDISVPLDSSVIISIVGPRRSGKTFLMYRTIEKLRETVPVGNILYVNFEHERLRNLDANDLSDMIAVYYEISHVDHKKKIYLFLDEIQAVTGWNKWVNRMYELKEFQIYLSGSSSKLLSRELSTELRGRSVDFTVFPYNFREYLKVKGVPSEDQELLLHSEKRGIIIGALRDFIKTGGFPEVVSLKSGEEKLLKSYVDTIIIKDVGERFRIEPSVLSVFFSYAISAYSKYFTGTKAYNYLKTLNYSISHEFPLQLMDHFNEVFALLQVEIFSFSVKSKKQYPRKLYVVDTGLINSAIKNAEMGRLIENIVFIELARRSEYFTRFRVFYWKEYGKSEGKEVDFVIMEGNSVIELINVTFASSREGIPEREISGLLKAAEELKCKKLRIITWDYFEKGDIEYTPLWYWLLSLK
ncbi:MAG: ATP-binding protein [Thermoplasmataceae archaeon]